MTKQIKWLEMIDSTEAGTQPRPELHFDEWKRILGTLDAALNNTQAARQAAAERAQIVGDVPPPEKNAGVVDTLEAERRAAPEDSPAQMKSVEELEGKDSADGDGDVGDDDDDEMGDAASQTEEMTTVKELLLGDVAAQHSDKDWMELLKFFTLHVHAGLTLAQHQKLARDFVPRFFCFALVLFFIQSAFAMFWLVSLVRAG